MTDKTFELIVDEFKFDADKAILVVVDGAEYWIPKSQIKAQDENSLTITDWIAKQKGFIK